MNMKDYIAILSDEIHLLKMNEERYDFKLSLFLSEDLCKLIKTQIVGVNFYKVTQSSSEIVIKSKFKTLNISGICISVFVVPELKEDQYYLIKSKYEA